MIENFPDLTPFESISVQVLPGLPIWIFPETRQDTYAYLGIRFLQSRLDTSVYEGRGFDCRHPYHSINPYLIQCVR